MSSTDFWKTHPIFNFRIFGHDTSRFLENSSKIKHLVKKWYSKNSGAWYRPISGKLIQIWTTFPEIARAPIFHKNWILTKNWLMNFPKIGPAHTPEIKISKKYWTSCPEIRLSPGKTANSGWEISGWVFQDLAKMDKVNFDKICPLSHKLWLIPYRGKCL